MSQTNTLSQPILTSVAAHLYVRDLKSSTDFFTSKLGFAVDFVYGDPPFYGQVSRDNARLALRQMDDSFFEEDIRHRESLLLCLNHAGHRRRNQAAFSRLPGGRRASRSALER